MFPYRVGTQALEATFRVQTELAMNEEQDPRNSWQRALPDYRGMGPTLGFVALGAVFAVLALLMLTRSGHDDARPPEPVKPGATTSQ
jgi:hypothetical protein